MKKSSLAAGFAATVVFLIGLVVAPEARAVLTPQLPPELEEGKGIVKSKHWAIVLGKALFWDQQVGSDGQACASCHFSAGADPRLRNVLTPGFLQEPEEDTQFGAIGNLDGERLSPSARARVGQTRSGAYPDSTYELKPEDFPIYEVEDYTNRNSKILIATNDAVSSPGSFDATFAKTKRFNVFDKCYDLEGDVFHAGKYPCRQVEPRNTPTMINAVFNLFNFWDGRANRKFNGVGVFGPRDIKGDPQKRLMVLDEWGKLEPGYLEIDNASLASQAVGPPLSEREMSCQGRTFPDVGRKMIMRRPLSLQKIHPYDSVLGGYRQWSGFGLDWKYLYIDLIKLAFEEKYWNSHGRYVITDDGKRWVKSKNAWAGYTQLEQNFSMFWGISIMLYEATLISDQSKFDTWFASCRPSVSNPGDPLAVPIANPVVTCQNSPADPTALEHGGLTAQEVLGFGLFNNGGTGIRNPGNPSCSGCHPVTNPNAVPLVFPLFSEAQFQAGQTFVPVERSRIDDRGPGTPKNVPTTAPIENPTVEGAVHDRGFFNIGTRPTSFDPGIGGNDIYGNPLSVARMFVMEQAGWSVVDPSGITDPCNSGNLIEGGFPNLTLIPELNQGRYPGCIRNPPCVDCTVDPSFDWSKERELVDGSMKTPGLRNVGLTPPYFHFGGYSNLRDVVRFYARGGSRRDKSLAEQDDHHFGKKFRHNWWGHQEENKPPYTGDTSGTGSLGKDAIPVKGSDFGTNVDFFIRDIKSTDEQIDALVAFMLTLTDKRVQCDLAPFDHPSLFVIKGHREADRNRDQRADDDVFELPEVGAEGYDPDSGFCIPNEGDLFAEGMQARAGGERVTPDGHPKWGKWHGKHGGQH